MSDETPQPVERMEPVEPVQRRNGFWKGLIGFLVPITALSLLSMVGPDGSLLGLWFAAAALLLVALIGAIVFHVRKRPDIGNGALAALGLGIVFLFGTCVYNLSNLPSNIFR